MKPQPKTADSLWRIFRWPLLIALVTLAGLVSALIGDGGYDVLSWLLLGGLLALMAALWRCGA